MLVDTICSSLLILADMRHQRRAERQMARQAEKLCMSANCFLTLFWVCVCVCRQWARGLWDHHRMRLRVMTAYGPTRKNLPTHTHCMHTQNWQNIMPHQTLDNTSGACSHSEATSLCCSWISWCHLWGSVRDKSRCNLYPKVLSVQIHQHMLMLSFILHSLLCDYCPMMTKTCDSLTTETHCVIHLPMYNT